MSLETDTPVQARAGFFGPGTSRIFGVAHLPAAGSLGGVVVCSPIQAEFLKNYRREVLLGRSLCGVGIAVQRFHYRGSGHSDGDARDATFETMVDDSVIAAEYLIKHAGVTKLVFTGTRWGAVVAAAAAARFGHTPLALWEPVIDPKKYFNDIFRSNLIRDLKGGSTARRSGHDLIEELQHVGSLDILGYPISWTLYESAIAQSLAEVIGEQPSQLFLVQMSRQRDLRSEYAALAQRWQQRGFQVETAVFEEKGTWWFVGDDWQPDDVRTGTKALVQATVDWAARQLRS